MQTDLGQHNFLLKSAVFYSLGQVVKEFIYLNDQPIATFTSLGINYIHDDQLGTPVKMMDALQLPVWTRTADPFGNTIATTGLTTLNLRFPGQYHDDESGLDQNGFRSYSAFAGRYTQPDPIGLAGGINRYAYVGGNPVNRIDPWGLAWIPPNIYGPLQPTDSWVPYPPASIPGGPFTPAGSGQRPGTFYGPQQSTGGKTMCQYVPSSQQGGPPGSTGYWKTLNPNNQSVPGEPAWQHYDINGNPITPEQAHPGPGLPPAEEAAPAVDEPIIIEDLPPLIVE